MKLIKWIMRILYHPKRILGFETYVAPEGFDRKAQPVDIYDVFERYYRYHRTAKWIYSVNDATAFSVIEEPSTNWSRYSYLDGGIRYNNIITTTTLNQTIPQNTNPTSIKITDVTKLLDPSVTGRTYESICFRGYLISTYLGYVRYNYTSIDYATNTIYGSFEALPFRGGMGIGENVCQFIYWKGTSRYVIVGNNSGVQQCSCSVNGAEWLYCGKDINSIQTSGSGATTCTIKWIHIDKLDNITNYYYCAHYGHSTLTGTLHLSRGVVGFTNPFADPEGYPYRGNLAFQGCSGITGHLTIPAEFDNIRPGMFNGVRITSLTIEEGILNIGDTAFGSNTYNTGSLTIPDSCVRIGASAFYNNNKIISLDLGEGVVTIGNGAFQSCALMAGTLTLPDSLTTIGTMAFYGCTSFSGTLTIPANITSIGQGAFGDDNFTDIDVTSNAGYEDVDDVLYEISTRTALHSVKSDTGTLTFQSNTLIIGDYCCLRNLRTGTLTVPDSVTRVGIYAFYDCDGFTAIVLETTSSALATIDDYAFSHCSNLAGTLTLPNSVTLVDAGAFRDDVLITGIVFSSALVTIGADAFRQMTAISENLVLPNSVETIGAAAFYNNTARTGTLTLGTGLKTIGGQAFGNIPLTGTLSIPSLVTAIGEAAFWNNNFSAISSAATGFTVSDYVLYDETASGQIKAHTSARGYAGTLTLKAGTTSVLYLCFYNNDNRSGAIVIPYTVTLIRQQAFDDCSGFNSTATIGDTTNGSALTSIEAYAFRGCANITGWNIYRTPAPTCNNSFSGYAKPLHIKVGATGYDVTPATAAAPWTNTAIFSSVTADL